MLFLTILSQRTFVYSKQYRSNLLVLLDVALFTDLLRVMLLHPLICLPVWIYVLLCSINSVLTLLSCTFRVQQNMRVVFDITANKTRSTRGSTQVSSKAQFQPYLQSYRVEVLDVKAATQLPHRCIEHNLKAVPFIAVYMTHKILCKKEV